MSRPALAAAIARVTREVDFPVVLIDGRAGSGKTTLAQQLVSTWPVPGGARLVSLDDLYPGWGGLAAGAAAVPALIRQRRYRSWDWGANRAGPWRTLPPRSALVVEGCGAITPASAAVADLSLWLELDATTRRNRAIARDGELFAAHWDDWASQESEHWHANRPAELADLVLSAG